MKLTYLWRPVFRNSHTPWTTGRLGLHMKQTKVQSSPLISMFSTVNHTPDVTHVEDSIKLLGNTYVKDSLSNVSPRVASKVGKLLHNKKYHPLNLIKLRIQNHFYASFVNRVGNPLFAVFDNISPVVTPLQNFDSLLVPENHVSRSSTDTYYVNNKCMLRSHTSAHQADLIRMGLDAFLVVGDVYRRDEIDSSHYPVFHQVEGVQLFSDHELFSRVDDPTGIYLFENGKRTTDKQEYHTVDAAKLLEHDLKRTLQALAAKLFGKHVKYRWVDCYFPFTHPSWELELYFNGDWMEVLGCGLVEQQIINAAGATSKVGWAFGLGLERLAMKLYDIPDIRLFWSEDEGFLHQFRVENPETQITYKPISQFPPCVNDISFWVPESFSPNDFYDVLRNVAGDIVEQVTLVDEFEHPKTGRVSHCYRIVYRHMDKTFSQDEVNAIHQQVELAAANVLGVEIR